MSLKTRIQNLRTDQVERQMRMNATLQGYSDRARATPLFGVSFALGFAFLLMALAGIGAPADAATLNESIGPILDSVTELFVPLLALIIAAVPLIVAISVIGFIIGILAAILGKLHI